MESNVPETKTKAASLAATATSLQNEIDYYRERALASEKRTRRLRGVAIAFSILALVATALLVTLGILSNNGVVRTLPLPFFIAAVALPLLLLLLGLIFLGMARDEHDLELDCLAREKKQTKKLEETLAAIEEERKKEQMKAIVESLPPMERSPRQKLADALRITAATLEALSLPLSALAAMRKGRR